MDSDCMHPYDMAPGQEKSFEFCLIYVVFQEYKSCLACFSLCVITSVHNVLSLNYSIVKISRSRNRQEEQQNP